MIFVYLDESGDAETLAGSSPAHTAPVFVTVGLLVHSTRLRALTSEYLQLKKRFFPGRFQSGHHLDAVLGEVKGSEIRKRLREGRRNVRRQTLGFVDQTLRCLERAEARLVGRVYVKQLDTPCVERSMYTYSVQSLHEHVNHFLRNEGETGLFICDSRTKVKNTPIAHSVFTRKFKPGGDDFDRILEAPTFGHSDNHVGVQLADIIAAGYLFPVASLVCADQRHDPQFGHLFKNPEYGALQAMFGTRIKALQYRYQEAGKWRGGVTLSDPVGKNSGGVLF